MRNFSPFELSELYSNHAQRSTKVWGPGDTYEVCLLCDRQVYGGNDHLCTVQRLIKMIQDLQREVEGEYDYPNEEARW